MKGYQIKENKWISYCIIFIAYMVATVVGIFAFYQFQGALWMKLLTGDIAATLFIWVVSFLLQNASLYDPYWSVQPIVILTLLLIKNGRYDLGSILTYIVIVYWGIRLTANWAYTFDGLHKQDWRYDQLKEQTGRLFQLVNLAGIQLMPTFIVYLCILPASYLIELDSVFTYKILFGLITSTAAATMQMVADAQMQRFRKENVDKSMIIRCGLWKYSRHPNYLGEILMWWGIYLTFLAVHTERWYLGIGALVNTLLFLFISIPLSEKRLASYKDGYEEYKKGTRKLLPIPRDLLTLKRSKSIDFVNNLKL